MANSHKKSVTLQPKFWRRNIKDYHFRSICLNSFNSLTPLTPHKTMKIGNIEFGPQPLFLAPMEDVTDIGFRMLCKRFGAAMVYTEFVSAEALVRSIKSTVSKLTISDEERPVGIQIYGRTTEDMVEAAKIVEQAKPDVIDINFGCPVKKVAGKGAGAGMLRNIPLMRSCSSKRSIFSSTVNGAAPHQRGAHRRVQRHSPHPSPPCRLPYLQGHSRFSPDENRHAESHYRGGTERDIERMPRENQGDRIRNKKGESNRHLLVSPFYF